MSYRAVKVLNMFLGAICFGLEMYAYTHTDNELLTDVDSFLVIIASFCLVESVFGILLCNKQGDCCCFTLWKYCLFILLVFMGGALIIETFQFSDDGVPSCPMNPGQYVWYKKGRHGCQYFHLKIAAGVLFGINGVVYLLLHPDQTNHRDRPVVVTVPSSSRPRRTRTPAPPSSGTRSQGTPRAVGNTRTTTIITASPNTTTTIIMPPRNVPPQAPLVPVTTGQGPPCNFAQTQGIPLLPRPLPSVPYAFDSVQAPFAPSAPPPAYFDCPPPYSTLPPNAQPPRDGGKF